MVIPNIDMKFQNVDIFENFVKSRRLLTILIFLNIFGEILNLSSAPAWCVVSVQAISCVSYCSPVPKNCISASRIGLSTVI